MYCGNCGKLIEDNARFCMFCGSPLIGEIYENQEVSKVQQQEIADERARIQLNAKTKAIKELAMRILLPLGIISSLLLTGGGAYLFFVLKQNDTEDTVAWVFSIVSLVCALGIAEKEIKRALWTVILVSIPSTLLLIAIIVELSK